MKKVFSILIAALLATTAFAQNSVFRQRLELAQCEDETTGESLEVFQMQDNGRYYLSVGHLGVGTDIIQVQLDPIFELFIPLGETLTEALDRMKTMQSWYKMSRKESKIIEGCLSAAFPNDVYETVVVTRRQFLTAKVLEFGIEREGYVRAAHIGKMDFSSLVTSLKLYKKLHPKEQ